MKPTGASSCTLNKKLLAGEGAEVTVFCSTVETIMDLGASKVKFFGKPYPEVYELVTKSLSEIPLDKIAMCGDSLHTDILGAAAMGWKTVLVTKDGLFSGFDTKSYCEESGVFPNWRLERLI